MYEGHFAENQPHGFGRKIYKDGCVFVGQWQ